MLDATETCGVLPNRGGGERARRGGHETRPPPPTSATRRRSSRWPSFASGRLPDVGRSPSDPAEKRRRKWGESVGRARGDGAAGRSSGGLVRSLIAFTRTPQVMTWRTRGVKIRATVISAFGPRRQNPDVRHLSFGKKTLNTTYHDKIT